VVTLVARAAPAFVQAGQARTQEWETRVLPARRSAEEAEWRATDRGQAASGCGRGDAGCCQAIGPKTGATASGLIARGLDWRLGPLFWNSRGPAVPSAESSQPRTTRT